MGRDRTALVLYLAFLALSFVAVAIVGYQAVEARRVVLEGELANAARRGLDAATSHLARVLSERESIEDQRPYYEYNSLFYERGTYSNQIALTNTSLWRPETPLIEVYVQLERPAVNDAGVVGCTFPLPPPELQAAQSIDLSTDEARRVLKSLLGTRILADFGEPMVRPVPKDVFMFNCDTEEIATNIALANRNDRASQSVLIEQGMENWASRSQRGVPEIPVSYTGFCYFGEILEGQPRLVALRSVTLQGKKEGDPTPRTILQGFFIDTDRLLGDELELIRRQLAADHLRLEFCFGEDEPKEGDWSVSLAQAFPIRGELARCTLVASPLELGWIADEMRSEKLRYFTILGVLFLAMAVTGFFVARLVRAEIELARKKSDFVAAVSHELKTPLTGIRLCADMLEEGWVDDPEKRREYVASIAGESERLSRLIDNVLTFARLEGGKTSRLELQTGDVEPILRKTLRAWAPHLERHGFTLRLKVTPGLSPAVHDPDALAQMLVNLLDNAVKYGQLGDGPRVIDVALEPGESKTIGLRVSDRGPGFGAGVVERCFEPFYRVDAEMTRKTKGTGIGLALVRSLAEAQGATVTARHREGGGAEVTVQLQAAPA